MAENGAADPHMSGTEPDRKAKIRAHAHGQQFQPVARGDLGRQGEMGRRRIVDRRDAHEPRDVEPIGCAAGGDECVGLFRQDAGLLRFGAGVDLDEQQRRAALPVDRPSLCAA